MEFLRKLWRETIGSIPGRCFVRLFRGVVLRELAQGDVLSATRHLLENEVLVTDPEIVTLFIAEWQTFDSRVPGGHTVRLAMMKVLHLVSEANELPPAVDLNTLDVVMEMIRVEERFDREYTEYLVVLALMLIRKIALVHSTNAKTMTALAEKYVTWSTKHQPDRFWEGASKILVALVENPIVPGMLRIKIATIMASSIPEHIDMIIRMMCPVWKKHLMDGWSMIRLSSVWENTLMDESSFASIRRVFESIKACIEVSGPASRNVVVQHDIHICIMKHVIEITTQKEDLLVDEVAILFCAVRSLSACRSQRTFAEEKLLIRYPQAHLHLYQAIQAVHRQSKLLPYTEKDTVTPFGCSVLTGLSMARPEIGMDLIKMDPRLSMLLETSQKIDHVLSLVALINILLVMDSLQLPPKIDKASILWINNKIVFWLLRPCIEDPRHPKFSQRTNPGLAFGASVVFHNPSLATTLASQSQYVETIRLSMDAANSTSETLRCLGNLAITQEARMLIKHELTLGDLTDYLSSSQTELTFEKVIRAMQVISNLAKLEEYQIELACEKICLFILRQLVGEIDLPIEKRVYLSSLALCAVINLAKKCLPAKRMLNEFDFVQLCGRFLNLFEEHRQVCELTMWALFNLCNDNPSAQLKMFDKANAEALVYSFARWKRDERVATRACKVLWVVCKPGSPNHIYTQLNVTSVIESSAASQAIQRDTIAALLGDDLLD